MNKYLKIFFILVAAFVFSNLANSPIFITNTPKVNSLYIARIPDNIGNFFQQNVTNKMSKFASIFSFSQNNTAKIENTIANSVFQPLNKGVYASTYQDMIVIKFVQNQIEWKQYTFTLRNGKQITVRVPGGDQSPTQTEMETIFK